MKMIRYTISRLTEHLKVN